MKVTPIESVVNIYDNNIRWADLGSRFNGYQISTTGIIRSMKFYKKYPYGTLVSIKDGKVNLSNSLNQVEQVDIKDLLKDIKDYPHYTCDTYTRSRNPLITSQSDRVKEKLKVKDILNQPSGFHFKTID